MPQLRKNGSSRVVIEPLALELDRIREASGLSLRDIARILDLSPATLTRIRHGHRPDAEALALLLAWLDLPVTSLIAPGDAALEGPQLPPEVMRPRPARGRPPRGRVRRARTRANAERTST